MKVESAPDRIFEEFFEAVQATHLFADSKTFVDAVARSDPADVLAAYRAERDQPGFELLRFVATHFEIPGSDSDTPTDPKGLPVEDRIEELWDVLTREADEKVEHSSLIPLPNPYVVPGGRFREVYYWDSYFTMLGLADSGRLGLIADMVENFAFLIDEIGFIPNGNRTYYCTRSQPPYFAMMVELLAESSNAPSVYLRYLPQLKKEYAFWMSGADEIDTSGGANRRVIRQNGTVLNRYWDDAATPRQESYAEDVALAASCDRDAAELYRDVRAGAESGWDFTSRWFADPMAMSTIRTTHVVPVDLNSLLYNLERTIADVCRQAGDKKGAEDFGARAGQRADLIRTLFFDDTAGMFMDLEVPGLRSTGTLSLAAAYPLFFGIATDDQAARVAERIHGDFLASGGWLTTLVETGQQWDRPNGWAPLQWIAYCGLERYGFHDEARAGASRWVDDNVAIYRNHGRLLEKYNVEERGLAGAGGEYEVQDGFGWTNAVLLRLMHQLSTGK